MRFEDEPYVRIYRRKTVTFHKLGEAGRTVWFHLLLEFDRAGIFDLAGADPHDAVQTVCHLSAETVTEGLARCLELKCLIYVPERDCLFAPNFMAAQEAKQSNVLKQKIKRDRAKARTRMLELSEDPAVAALVESEEEDEEWVENDCDTRGVGSDTSGVANNRSQPAGQFSSETHKTTPEVSQATLFDTHCRSSRSSRSSRSNRSMITPAGVEDDGDPTDPSSRAVDIDQYRPSTWLLAHYRARGLREADIEQTLGRYHEQGQISVAPQASHDTAFERWLENDLERAQRRTNGRQPKAQTAAAGGGRPKSGARAQPEPACPADRDARNGGRPARRDSELNASLRAKQSILRLPSSPPGPERS